ncbi:hypothetical protein XENORESO_001800 [Xenotaenia resolanae]|uniref:Uncharacterized protein n=1 Tax=Xenotaenia resolanae TaxID=208358 RepID=A0ABV0WZZ7_9TELE
MSRFFGQLFERSSGNFRRSVCPSSAVILYSFVLFTEASCDCFDNSSRCKMWWDFQVRKSDFIRTGIIFAVFCNSIPITCFLEAVQPCAALEEESKTNDANKDTTKAG